MPLPTYVELIALICTLLKPPYPVSGYIVYDDSVGVIPVFSCNDILPEPPATLTLTEL